MKKRWMVVASIAGIAWLAIGVWSLLSWSTWDSGDTSSFVVQQVWDGWWLQAWGEMPISTGQYSWSLCGNGDLDWWEQCEKWFERKCITWSINPPWGVCNTATCMCEIEVSTGTTCQDLKVGAGVRFVPWTSNNPKFWWTIYTKVGRRSIDCPSNPNTNNIKIHFSPRWSYKDFRPIWPLNVNFEVWTYKLECGEYISYWSWSAGYAISCEYQVVIEQSKIGTGKTVTWVDMKNPGM